MEYINEEINRISELMGINEAPPRKKVVSTAAKEKVAMNAAQARQASLEKSAEKKKVGTTSSKVDDVTQSAKPISKKKKIVLNDVEVQQSLETALGPTMAKKARIEFEGMPDEKIIKYVDMIESSKFSRLPETIQEKLNKIYRKDPNWIERWRQRMKKMPIKYQAIFWGCVFFGGVFVLGAIVKRGISGFIQLMTKPMNYLYELGKKSVESDWESYVKNLDNYKVEDENGTIIGTLKDVLTPEQTISNPIYTNIQNKVDSWVDENGKNYTPTTMIMAMEGVLKYIIDDIDAEFNSKYYVNPMSENDPSRPTLKNKSKDYWERLKTSVSNAKQSIK